MKRNIILVLGFAIIFVFFVFIGYIASEKIKFKSIEVTAVNSNSTLLASSPSQTAVPYSPTNSAIPSSSTRTIVPSSSTQTVAPVSTIQTVIPSNSMQTTLPSSVNDKITLIAVGDILLGRGVEFRLNSQRKDYKYPFEKVAKILKKGDIIFGNLEEPFTEKTKSLDPGWKIVLKSRTEAIEGIKYAGFNVLSLANNHIMDYYEDGLYDTIKLLDKNSMMHTGAGENLSDARTPIIYEKNGVKIGILAYTEMANILYKGKPSIKYAAGLKNAGVAPLELNLIKADIKNLRKKVDVLIVSLHWGVEYVYDISKAQQEVAHTLIDSGADMILGHHAHRIKGIETYKEKPIVYSLGNFIFDQNDPNNQEAFILDFDFRGKKLEQLTAIPVRTVNKTQIIPVYGKSAEALLDKGYTLSKALSSNCKKVKDTVVFYFKNK